jgi:hypothetical protein
VRFLRPVEVVSQNTTLPVSFSIIASRIEYNPASGETCTMKKQSKTAAELEASIKVEMEDICDWPTDMTISVQPDGDSWKVKVVQEGSVDDADRREMVEQIAARLKGEYDLKG